MIILGSDHAGFSLKEKLKKYLLKKGISFIDVGANSFDANDDYPDFAKAVSELVLQNNENKGVLICGSGVGMSIAANKVKGVRASVGINPKQTKLAVEHNHINVLTLGGRVTSYFMAKRMIHSFLETKYQEGRHIRRVGKLE